MDRAEFLREIASHRAYCKDRSPLYYEILKALGADAVRSPRWLGMIEDVWRTRRFSVGWESVHLLLACMHVWALRDEAPELAAVYPSCFGFRAGSGAAATAFLRRAPSAFWEELRNSHLQTNEISRSIAWLLPAAAAFRPINLAFHLVEMGAAAGLNLIGDHFPHACRVTSTQERPPGLPSNWSGMPYDVLTRTGLDRRPLQLSRAEDRLWLKACVWADDLARLESLERTFDLYLTLKTPSEPALERVDFSGMPDWLCSRRRPRPEQGLLVFNTASTVFLSDEEYAELREKMVDALAPWEDRALWVECELPRGSSLRVQELAVHRIIDGKLRKRTLALMDARPREVRVLDGWDFLQTPLLGPQRAGSNLIVTE